MRQGDIAGLEYLVRLHQLPALRLAYALTRDEQAAEDAVADAFLAVYERIELFDPTRPFAPWFYRIVINQVRGALRAVKRARQLEGVEQAFDSREDEALTPEIEAVRADVRRQVVDSVQRLPPKQREAVVLRYYLDMDERDIAQAIGCPWGTVRWRLHMARKRLRGDLGQEFDEQTTVLRAKGEVT